MIKNEFDAQRVAITEILTQEEIEKCVKKYEEIGKTGKFAAWVDENIITPNLERINRTVQQENDSRYLAYFVACVMMEIVE